MPTRDFLANKFYFNSQCHTEAIMKAFKMAGRATALACKNAP